MSNFIPKGKYQKYLCNMHRPIHVVANIYFTLMMYIKVLRHGLTMDINWVYFLPLEAKTAYASYPPSN